MGSIYQMFRYSLHPKLVDLLLEASIGGTGAPTIAATSSRGINGIFRVSAGIYGVSLESNFEKVRALNVSFSGALIAASPNVNLLADKTASGSSAAIVLTTPAAGNTFTVAHNGATYTWTLIANGATPANSYEIAIGTGGSINADTATAIQTAVNATTATTGVSCVAYAGQVILTSKYARANISRVGTPLAIKTVTSGVMSPHCLFFVCAASGTATDPASGETMKAQFVLSNA